MGAFDIAAGYYTQHARMNGTNAAAAAERALSFRIALTDVDAATKLADELAIDGRHGATERSNWLLSTAALVRAVRGPAAAGAWLRQHDALLEQTGMAGAITDHERVHSICIIASSMDFDVRNGPTIVVAG